MNRTLLDERFRVQGRIEWYTAPDEIIAASTPSWLSTTSGAPTGYRIAGRTPAKTLYDLISEQWLLPAMSDAAQQVRLAR